MNRPYCPKRLKKKEAGYAKNILHARIKIKTSTIHIIIQMRKKYIHMVYIYKNMYIYFYKFDGLMRCVKT